MSGTCKTCRWWSATRREVQIDAACQHRALNDSFSSKYERSYLSVDGESEVITACYFGCVHHEPQETTP